MRHLFLTICAIALLCSCSYIGEDERLIYVKPADVHRNVLIEDFTGQRCVNCPNAANEIAKLQELYGEEHVIAVAIHGGPLAFYSNAKVTGLRSALADEYYNAAGIEANPMGLIDKTGAAVTPDQWQSAVARHIEQTATVDMEIDCRYDAEANRIDISTTMLATESDVKGKLLLWLTEDSITAMQMMPDGSANADYVHNHVLRAAVNGMWGESVSLAVGQTATLPHSIAIEPEWKPQNLSVIAFVYNEGGVMQVVKSNKLKIEKGKVKREK